jgi:RNA processing factor Prp31
MKDRKGVGQRALLTRALKAENLWLQKRIAKLLAEKMSLANRIRVLEEELKQERSEPKVRELLAKIAERGRSLPNERARALPNPAPNTDARQERSRAG